MFTKFPLQNYANFRIRKLITKVIEDLFAKFTEIIKRDKQFEEVLKQIVLLNKCLLTLRQ